MVDLARRLSELPGDLFSIKSNYLRGFQAVVLSDYSSGAVVLGKAGERMAKGALDYYQVPYDRQASFDTLLRTLSRVSPSPVLIVGLRTVLKYRNQAAHDTQTELSSYDLDAAVSAFCAAYQAVYTITGDVPEAPSPGHNTTVSRDNSPGLKLHQALKDNLNKLTLVSAVLLLMAVVRGGSYDFFLLLRIVVTTNACLLAYRDFRKQKGTALLFCGIAVLFNPIIPVYLSRDVWRLIDAGVMGILVWSILRKGYRR